MWLLVFSVLAALSISALCSLMEAALLSLQPSQITDISTRWPKIGKIWAGFKEQIEKPIAAILILNTTAHTIGASVAGAEFGKTFGEKWIWAFSLVFTLLMLQFTEILPKSAGVRFNRQVAIWIARPLTWLIYLLAPVVHFVHGVNRILFGGDTQAKATATLEEITALAGLARLTHEISPRQERIIEGGANISQITVRAIMRPRIEIEALDVNTPPEQIVDSVVMSGFSRLPVYEEDPDNIIGFVYIKDILRQLHLDLPIELTKLMRPAPLIPETLPLDQLLQVFHRERTQMAIALNEHGSTVGLVTMEDVLEEFVGEIYDEHRHAEEEITKRNETSWFAHGTTSLRDLLETVDRLELRPEIPEEINTISGLMQKLLDRIPSPDDSVQWHDLKLLVITMEGNRIDRVLVTIEAETEEATE